MHVLVRIFLRESDEWEGEALYSKIVKTLQSKGVGGATVLKAILGYGTTGHYHYEGIEVMSYDLPVVVEFVEEEQKVEDVLKEVSKYLKSGLITVERAQIWV
ncbi:DUF190 domain-containing protein [Hydrogenobacter thermophilus]|uniref:DUF190 domain-containing protein n=1 Tax=Hydrogenobacter thermophilus TaxID=940 RepID=UPI0030FC1628